MNKKLYQEVQKNNAAKFLNEKLKVNKNGSCSLINSIDTKRSHLLLLTQLPLIPCFKKKACGQNKFDRKIYYIMRENSVSTTGTFSTVIEMTALG